MDSQILISTLLIDTETQGFFNNLRKQYFPAERNYLDAHLTLFHNLPGSEQAIIESIDTVCNNYNVFDMQVSKIVSIGNGVAYKIESPELKQLHKYLQQQFTQWLIPQDKQTLWPHITIQNKTDALIANQLINELNSGFIPFKVNALGFSLWEYKGGPWEFISEFRFKR